MTPPREGGGWGGLSIGCYDNPNPVTLAQPSIIVGILICERGMGNSHALRFCAPWRSALRQGLGTGVARCRQSDTLHRHRTRFTVRTWHSPTRGLPALGLC
jgi:hypothetical protein